MSLLPGQILPPSATLGKVNENGDVTINYNWWLLLYNLCAQVLGTSGEGLAGTSVVAMEATDLDVVGADSPSIAKAVSNLQVQFPEAEVVPSLREITNALLIALGQLEENSTLPGLASPTAKVGLTVVNGSATTAMRSDAAPPIDQGITPTWTGLHTFQGALVAKGNTASFSSAASQVFLAGSSNADVVQCNTNAGTDAKVFDSIVNSSGQLIMRCVNDTFGSATAWITVSRSGQSPTGAVLNIPIGVNGNAAPAQSTGWGTPTNGAVQNNFNASTATLAQTAAAVAQLISIFKSIGFLGA